jgi:uncharacterized protein (TIGR02246 family)
VFCFSFLLIRWSKGCQMGMGCVVSRCLVGCFVGCLAWATSLPVCGQVAGAGKPRAAAPSPRATDEQAIRAATAAYQQALDRWDGKAMADLWTADGDIIDGDGRVMHGRETVSLTAMPTEGEQRPDFRIHETNLRFLSADVALEDGTVEVTPNGSSTPLAGRFSATWLRHNGAWKLAALRESPITSQTGGERLKDLDWMVGDWRVVDNSLAPNAPSQKPSGTALPEQPAHDKPLIEVSVRWNATHTYLLRDMKIPHDNGNSTDRSDPKGSASKGSAPTSHVTQRIGWDPLSRQICSWSFGSDGGRSEAVWSHDGDSWIARTTAVLLDGSQTSSLNVYTYNGTNECLWKSFHTHAGSDHLPQVNMTMIRIPEKPLK